MIQKEQQKFDVFISYRHETGFYMAQIVYSRLVSNGYSVFMDKTMNSGKYEEKIHNAINNCSNFIVILFPDDIEACQSENSWLSKEASLAIEYGVENIVPILCDGFDYPESDELLTKSMKTILKNQGLIIHKDYAIDRDLDNLCDCFLKNTNPSKPRVTTAEFFKYNLNNRADYTVTGADIAFHAGSPWLTPGEKNDILVQSLKSGIHWRVLINTVEAAESIGKHMRDETALYIPFDKIREQWKKMSELYPDVLEVRECDIPLIHVHHSVKFINNVTGNPYGELHIKYYAYNHTRPDNSYEHTVSSFSKYYSIYNDEFEFLWNRSTPVLQ